MKTSWLIGGDRKCDLVVDRPSVSGQHCRLSYEAGGYFLEDLRSMNGTYVGGVRIATRTRVRRGDAITLGRTTPMPWPAEDPLPATRLVRVGRAEDNDVVIDILSVSSHHARIICDDHTGEVIIEDLGSANGTAIASPDRKVSRAPLAASDTVYLGSYPVAARTLLERWPEAGNAGRPLLVFRGVELVLGRDASCDSVIDLPMVSGRHARLLASGTSILIEDLGSSNGTFVNGARIQRPTGVRAGDLIGLGSYTLQLVDGSAPAIAPAPNDAADYAPLYPVAPPGAPADPVMFPAASSTSPATLSPLGVLGDVRGHALLFAQAVVLGCLLVLAFGRAARLPAADDGEPPRAAHAVAATLFGLGLAALWLGAFNAFRDPITAWAVAPREPGLPAAIAARVALLVALGAVSSAVLLAIVHPASGLKGPWLPMLGLVALASVVGQAMGQALAALGFRPGWNLAIYAAILLPLGLLGGPWRPLPSLSSAPRLVAVASPALWLFEDLLLLESRGRAEGAAPEPPRDGSRPLDLIEAYFPADSARMGLKAGLIAIETSIVEFALLAVVISMVRTTRRGAPGAIEDLGAPRAETERDLDRLK